MVEKEAFRRPVLPLPVDRPALDAGTLLEYVRAQVREAIHHRLFPAEPLIVELHFGAVDEAGVEEFSQPVYQPFAAVAIWWAQQCDQVIASEKSVAIEILQSLNISIREIDVSGR